MPDKKSFIFYHDQCESVRNLPKELFADLILSVMDYSSTMQVPDFDPTMNALFMTFKNTIDRDLKKYEKTCKRNRENGMKHKTQSKPVGSSGSHNKPVGADSGNDTDSDKKDITSLPPLAVEITDILVEHVKSLNPSAKNVTVNLDRTRITWAEDIDKINRIDKREYSEIKEVLNWAIADDFWFKNILSGSKLRKQFDALNIKRQSINLKNDRSANYHFVGNGKSFIGEDLCDGLTRAEHLAKYGRVS